MNRATIGLLFLALQPGRPVAAQCPDGSPPPCRAPPARVSPPPNSVAVLYFDNLSPDTVDAYLADGLTEEIIARLGQIDRLEIKSRTAVQRYRGNRLDDPAAVGQRLRVVYLLNGSVRRAGARLRVNTELVRAATGTRAWGEQFDRQGTDLLAIEEDIARAVATAVAGRLLPEERAALASRPTRNAVAYDHFLRGNYYLAQGTRRALARAVDEYEVAVRLDPRFADAVARIGLAYWEHVRWGWNPPGIPPESIYVRARAFAKQAMALDSASADAWTVLGIVLFHGERRYREARAALERALALDQYNPDAYDTYGLVLRSLGEDSMAVLALRRALALQPERPFAILILSDIFKAQRRITESRNWLDTAIALVPSFSYAYAMRALDRLWLKDTAGALADAETASRFAPPGYTGGEVALALVDVAAGNPGAARGRIEHLLCGAQGPDSLRSFNTLFLSMALAAIGEHDRALEMLESVQWSPLSWFWLRWPQFDAIRSHPRFQRLVEESRPPGALR